MQGRSRDRPVLDIRGAAEERSYALQDEAVNLVKVVYKKITYRILCRPTHLPDRQEYFTGQGLTEEL